jgi:hypothetical protein
LQADDFFSTQSKKAFALAGFILSIFAVKSVHREEAKLRKKAVD